MKTTMSGLSSVFPVAENCHLPEGLVGKIGCSVPSSWSLKRKAEDLKLRQNFRCKPCYIAGITVKNVLVRLV